MKDEGCVMNVMVVTANKNETEAVLSCTSFSYTVERSSDKNDPIFYNVGTWGHYTVTHFELISQGSVGADSAQLSIATAINNYHPDAVILVGIAFGKEFHDSENPSQYVGDVLISEKVADYESGKIKDGQLMSDGAIPESGRHLISIFKHYEKTWNHVIDGRKARCEFGVILSGDKVVDDRDFKAKLLTAYPRAIGGEMEGRGAYAACRNRGINEWIIVKGICDWADGTKGDNKELFQKNAAKSAVSLLDHIFSEKESLIKLDKNHPPNNIISDIAGNSSNIGVTSKRVVGHFVNFGITSCRLFEVYDDKKTLKEIKVISYEISDTKNSKYLDGIIEHVKNEVFPEIKGEKDQLFIKAFADSVFLDVFSNERKRNEFIMRFYTETRLYFNIVSEKQTEENLRKRFGNIGSSTAIVNIGSQYVDILVNKNKKFKMYNIPISLKYISEYLQRHAIPEEWSDKNILDIKNHINDKIKSVLNNVKVKNAIIIKDELTFMKNNGYRLVHDNGRECITIEDYKEANREFLFTIDYRKTLEKKYSDLSTVNRLYGFKIGHVLLETIFDHIDVETIVPTDELSIHGSISAYIFNIAISGSTTGEHADYMIEAYNIMRDMGATVLSPRIINGNLSKPTQKSDIEHACAIRECDLLFVSNKDGYIGEQTSHEIYGAYLLNKPIAFWKEPDESFDRLKFIPHEQWWNLMKTLEDN